MTTRIGQDAIEVKAVARYIEEQSSIEANRYVFAYHITIRNVGQVPAQLISRHWIITDAEGAVQEVEGSGVIGKQPLLRPGEQFEYTSWTRLATPHGRMAGSYYCISEDAHWFEAEIPAFQERRAVAAGKDGVDTHTLYPNGSNYQRLNPKGHANNPNPHGHGHLPGTGPGKNGQGPSLDPLGNVVPFKSNDAHWPIH